MNDPDLTTEELAALDEAWKDLIAENEEDKLAKEEEPDPSARGLKGGDGSGDLAAKVEAL